MKLIQIAMYNTSLSLLRILNAGYLVRGGIAFGDAYFDELGFFGPAVEEAYELESHHADVPIVALSPQLGKTFYEWEESETDMDIVNLLMTSRPMLVEKEDDKYFLSIFYQLETRMLSLSFEDSYVDIDEIKTKLFNVIARDKEKYKADKPSGVRKKLTIYEKLDWLERHLESKHNRLNPDIVDGGFSVIIGGD